MAKYVTTFHLILETVDNYIYYLLDDGRTWQREDLLEDNDVIRTFNTSREAALNWTYLYDNLLVRWPIGVQSIPKIEIICDGVSICAILIDEPTDI